MKDLVLYLAKNLVDQPDKVAVTSIEENGESKMTLNVAEEDKGKIIGKQGKVIKALRTVVATAAAKQNRKVLLDLQ